MQLGIGEMCREHGMALCLRKPATTFLGIEQHAGAGTQVQQQNTYHIYGGGDHGLSVH
ncbi:hypothetical protein KCP75_13605 [Salmonella enterica subsp. enterica]|nr:hypothetical protein KCP75_13605 [Salmonella enterica subsp. enterica]